MDGTSPPADVNQNTSPAGLVATTATAMEVSPTFAVNNFANSSPKDDTAVEEAVNMTPMQQKLNKNLHKMKSIGLTVDKQDMVDKMDGCFLVLGPQSAGKTQLTASLAGCDAFPSSQKLCTR